MFKQGSQAGDEAGSWGPCFFLAIISGLFRYKEKTFKKEWT